VGFLISIATLFRKQIFCSNNRFASYSCQMLPAICTNVSEEELLLLARVSDHRVIAAMDISDLQPAAHQGREVDSDFKKGKTKSSFLTAWEKNPRFRLGQQQPLVAPDPLAETTRFSTGTWGKMGLGQVCVPSCCQLMSSASAPLHPMARVYHQSEEVDGEQPRYCRVPTLHGGLSKPWATGPPRQGKTL